MKARIIAKSHFVNKVTTEYSINGRTIKHSEYHVIRKPVKACTTLADRIVFRAIHHVGNVWEAVYNHLDGKMEWRLFDTMQGNIDRHTV